ncbi:MAG: site-2 protease family protein [Dissulfurispiraceae bacterium]
MDYAFTMRQILISVIPILIAIILHEVAHGFVAYKLGDPTAKVMGRLTLNPISHIDPIGTILMPLLLYVFTNGQFVFGYAKPVPINPYNFRNPKRDMAIASIGGPATNIALAVVSTLLLKYVLIPLSIIAPPAAVAKIFEPLAMMLKASIVINVILATFNMIPIPPLDGGRVLMGLLPTKQASALGRLEPFGLLIVILFVATGMANYVIWPVILLILSLIGMR